MPKSVLPTTCAYEPFGRHWLATFLLLGPFYLNDFSNIWIDDWRIWLSIDYLFVKAVPLMAAVWLLRQGYLSAPQIGLVAQPARAFWATLIGISLLCTLIDQNAYALLDQLPGYAALGGMPAITSPSWDWIDLTFGLLLVGVCEELVFRGYMHHLISRYTQNQAVIIAVSSVAFGLIHWSLGLHSVLVTALIGAVLMMTYLRTRSLPAIVLAHFAINFIDFAGVVPKSIFQWV
jgi:membrane protease YdiL (CAAX protease family)